jgi:NAD-dependent DNA ligase
MMSNEKPRGIEDRHLREEEDNLNIEAAYSVEPTLIFSGKNFCLAGVFDGEQRSSLRRRVEALGGVTMPSVDSRTDALVIGSKGTRCCTFSCCQRVVEKALDLKKEGVALNLIREQDFMSQLEIVEVKEREG